MLGITISLKNNPRNCCNQFRQSARVISGEFRKVARHGCIPAYRLKMSIYGFLFVKIRFLCKKQIDEISSKLSNEIIEYTGHCLCNKWHRLNRPFTSWLFQFQVTIFLLFPKQYKRCRNDYLLQHIEMVLLVWTGL